MKDKKEIILNTDPSIVEYKQVSGWVGKDGRFYGKDERAARYANSTHATCECGNVMRKGWIKCEVCRAVSDLERYNKLPFEDGKLPKKLTEAIIKFNKVISELPPQSYSPSKTRTKI